MKVVVTGGSGKLGQVVVNDLLDHGHSVLSLDRVPSPARRTTSWTVDLRQSGDILQALRGAEGVIHLAAYPAPNLVSDSETFNNNIASTHNVLHAAYTMGVERAVVASSIAAFGLIYATREWSPEYLPLDDNHPCRPQDPYGLSKLLGEKIADSFAQKSDLTICSFRFPGLASDYEVFRRRWRDPAEGRKRLWTYIDIRDAAAACRAGLEAPFRGHEIFTASAPGSHHDGPTDQLLETYFPKTRKARKELAGNWSCLDGTKAERILGFRPQHRWEDNLT